MKINLLRKTLFVIMMMILTSTLIGCSHRKYTMDEKKEMVLNYMQEKYGEEFVGKAYNPAEIMKPYDVFYVYPKEKGEQSWVKVVGDAEHGQYVLIDGYFGQRAFCQVPFCVYGRFLKIEQQKNSKPL